MNGIALENTLFIGSRLQRSFLSQEIITTTPVCSTVWIFILILAVMAKGSVLEGSEEHEVE